VGKVDDEADVVERGADDEEGKRELLVDASLPARSARRATQAALSYPGPPAGCRRAVVAVGERASLAMRTLLLLRANRGSVRRLPSA